MQKYDEAKKISDKIIDFSKSLIKEGKKILDIAEEIEKKIFELGGKPAWPVNISINEVAAHYTPNKDDETVLKKDDLAKFDIGVHVDGYIWDRAFTVCIGKNKNELIDVAEKALKEALKEIKNDVEVWKISEIVEDFIVSNGFNPVRNLSGHVLERYKQHASPSIPNSKNNIKTKIKAGQAVAMEVFVTNGSGWVKESKPVLIYQFNQDKPARLFEAKKILQLAKEKFEKLPFATRWIDLPKLKMEMALNQLIEVNALHSYPVLKEISNGLVAQAEETVIVE